MIVLGTMTNDHAIQFFSYISPPQSVRSEDDDEFVVLQKPIGDIRRAFGEMRDR